MAEYHDILFFMKIISWNVNGIRAVEKKGFIDWLLKSGSDVVCIQETKANPAQLSEFLLNPASDAFLTEFHKIKHNRKKTFAF